MRVLVVGSGIAGMTAAFRLHQGGAEVEVLEADADLGGRMGTAVIDGYRIDRAASVFPGGYTQMVSLVADLGLTAKVRPSSDLVGIRRDGTTHRMRTSSRLDMIRSRSLSSRAKVRMVRALIDERRISPSLDWEDGSSAARWDTRTSADYARDRLGDELLDRLVEPAVATLSLASPEEVSMVDFFYGLHFMLAGGFFNFEGGSDCVIRAVADLVPVRCRARVLSVREHATGVTAQVRSADGDHTFEADACVLTGAAPQILAVHSDLAAEAHDMMSALRYTVSVGVHLGLTTTPSEEAMLIQVPAVEDPHLVSVTQDHRKGPGRTPTGRALITTNWRNEWSARMMDVDDDAVIEASLPSIERVLGPIGGAVDVAHVQRWRHAIAISTPGRYRDLGRLRRHLDPRARIQVAGDFHTISSTNGSLCAGQRAARNVLDAATAVG